MDEQRIRERLYVVGVLAAGGAIVALLLGSEYHNVALALGIFLLAIFMYGWRIKRLRGLRK